MLKFGWWLTTADMAFNSLFNVLSLGAAAREPNEVLGVVPTPSTNGFQSVTTTPEATLTFSGAPVAVTAVWKVLSAAYQPLQSLLWFPILLSLVVGLAIYMQGRPSAASGNRLPSLFFAVINSFTIAATVLGINQVASPEGTGQ